MIAINTQVPTTTGPPSPVERGYLSYSALRTYQGCPLRYYFKYIAGLPEETVSASLIFGSAIHRAIEHHYREQLAGNAAPPLFDLLREYQLGWTERQELPVRFNKSEDLTSLNQLAERVLSSFQAATATEQIGQILAVEETLLGDVIPGLPPLLGRVDLITLQPEALVNGTVSFDASGTDGKLPRAYISSMTDGDVHSHRIGSTFAALDNNRHRCGNPSDKYLHISDFAIIVRSSHCPTHDRDHHD